MKKTLIVILGPTGVGKTSISLRLAKYFNCSIVSSDSRQIYRETHIGTAAPSPMEMEQVKHHFIATRSISDHYSAGQYELDAIPLIESELTQSDTVLLVGGSMLYIDAICKGIDDIPTIDPTVREEMLAFYEREGIEGVRRQLKMLDPQHYEEVDLNNAKRMIHALEVCIMTGKTFSELRTNQTKRRSFNIIKIGLTRDREELYERINSRVDEMISHGLEDEARGLYPHRALNALNTVGYKELFNYFDGSWSSEFAIQMIKQNSRRYAKKQLTWFNRDASILWFHPDQEEEIERTITQIISQD